MFNEIADQYDRHRPGYPDVLIDRACEVADLAPGATVLEIGCGTGQLTRSLLARGLCVTAIEPGARLIARARDQLAGAGEVRFLKTRLEDAELPSPGFPAVFSASAIHWVDPDVGWRKLADALGDGGTIALLSYFGVRDSHSDEDQEALRAALGKVAPDLAGEWPAYRELGETVEGATQRADNLSDVWAYLGSYAVARPYAAELFTEVQIAALPIRAEHTAEELNALLGTMSFWARMSPEQQTELRGEHEALQRRLGRPIRSSTIAILVSARRANR